MAGKNDITATMGIEVNSLRFDEKEFKAKLDSLNKEITKSVQPIKISELFKGTVNASQGESFIQGLLDADKQIEKITASQNVYYSDEIGKINVLTGLLVKYKDAYGNILEVRQKINGTPLPEDAGFLRSEKAVMNLGQSLKGVNKDYQANINSFEKMSTKAADWYVRAERMADAEKKPIQESAKSLTELVNSYTDLANAGKTEGLGELEKKIRAQNAELDKNISASKFSATGIRKWTDTIQNAVKQTVAYTLSIGLMRNAQNLLNSAIEYTMNLNKEMTNIQVLQAEGAKTNDEIASLAKSYNSLAKEMASTTIEIAQGSVEWLRQGKTIAETNELLKSSTMLAKLGALSTANATEYLTAVLNSYKIASEDAISVVNKLVAVDNISATSTTELATALKYSASSAAEAGVSFEQLVSYIAVISSTTRINAESIGQAMKTIFARMQDIKSGKIDEDGLGLNNVESALARVDIKLRDSKDSFRDLGAVLEELSGRWNTLTEVEQANIAKAIAGVRQQNMFSVLMTNMSSAIKLQEEQYNSAGLAADRYQIYLDSLEAAQNELKASAEALYQGSVSNGTIKFFLEGATGAIDFITAIGGLKTAILILIPTLLAVNAVNLSSYFRGVGAAVNFLTSSIKTATITAGTWGVLMETLGTGGIALLIVGVAALIGYIYTLTQAVENNRKAFEEAKKEASSSASAFSSLKDTVDSIKSLQEEYETLSKKINKSSEESQRFIDIQNQLNQLSGGTIAGTLDSELNFRIENNKAIEQSIGYLEKELELKRKIAFEDAKSAAIAADKVSTDNQNRASEIESEIAKAKREIENLQTAYSWQSGEVKRAIQDRNILITNLMKKKTEIELANTETTNSVLAVWKNLTSEEDKENFKRFLNSKEALNAIMEYEDQEYFGRIREQYASVDNSIPVIGAQEFAKRIATAEESLNALDKALSDLGGNSSLSEQIDALDKLGIGYEIVDGKIKANSKDIKNNKEAILSAITDGVKLTDDMISQVNDLASSYDNVIYGVQLTKGQFETFASSMSSVLYDLATNSSIVLTDTAGNALQSADAVKVALANHLITYNELIVQLASASKSELDSVAVYAAKVLQYVKSVSSMSAPIAPTFSGGGGGGKDKAAEAKKKALQDRIDGLEKEKEALKDSLEEFEKYIDAQKESLKLLKEEEDFTDSLNKKNLSLQKMKAEIALLALDDSEEAKNKRLELEQDAADLEEEITQDKEDRKYDLQVEALDKAKQAYEDSINAQIDAIDDTIDKLKEQISAIDSASSSMGGLSAATVSYGDTALLTYQQIISAIENSNLLTDEQKTQIKSVIDWLYKEKASAEELLAVWLRLQGIMGGKVVEDLRTPEGQQRGGQKSYHSGGIVDVETHHDGNFAGNLKSNEVFAKLLKGELVATESQMSSFINSILPTMLRTSAIAGMQTEKSFGNINIEIPINIEGNATDETIEKIRKIIKEETPGVLTRALKQIGLKRSTTLTSI